MPWKRWRWPIGGPYACGPWRDRRCGSRWTTMVRACRHPSKSICSNRSTPRRLRALAWGSLWRANWPGLWGPNFNSGRLSRMARAPNSDSPRGKSLMERILIVDDDPGFRTLLETILRDAGYDVSTGATAADARRLGAGASYHLALTDLKLPDGDGLDVLRWFQAHAPEVPVIMITAFGTIVSAVEAMKLGAADYLGKPLASPEALRVLVRSTLEQRRIMRERDVWREQAESAFDP